MEAERQLELAGPVVEAQELVAVAEPGVAEPLPAAALSVEASGPAGVVPQRTADWLQSAHEALA